jgi:hypothetical protein
MVNKELIFKLSLSCSPVLPFGRNRGSPIGVHLRRFAAHTTYQL